MAFGKNLQTLRKKTGITQEKLAERMGVSRQTISNWEADVYPEMDKLLVLCDVFSCKLDDLIRSDMSESADYFSPVRVETVNGFRLARDVMITPNPEDDVQAYMRRWADSSGLAATDETYAIVTITEPHVASSDRIPSAYKLILNYLNANGFKEKNKSESPACFELEYEKDGVHYMDVHILVDAVGKGNLNAFMG